MATPPARLIAIMNRQKDARVNVRRVREWTEAALESMGCTGELGIHLVGAIEMAEVNWKFLQHEGSTDVITFDHGSTREHLHGELYLSVADALLQAAQFNTLWPEELGRYVIHGMLHLQGEDDLEPIARRQMKKRENQLVRQIGSIVPAETLENRSPPSGTTPRRSGPTPHG